MNSVNVKRFILAAIALFVFDHLYKWLVHGVLLAPLYDLTPGLWRSWPEMKAMMPFWLVVKLILAFWIAFMFTQFYREGKLKNGLRFGLYIGVLLAIVSGANYFWMPVPGILGLSWFFSYLIEGVIGGAILGAIYRK